jgi:adenosylmethionine-8-amino-7-oxononanoate aminotransferase
MVEENICAQANKIGQIMKEYMQQVAYETKKITNIRSIGAMVAADLIGASAERLGYAVYRKAVELGALLRPIGNTLYWLPPLNVNEDVLMQLKKITTQAINATLNSN